MPFWNQLNGQQIWKSESCYMVCTTGASSIYATKRGIARWANNNTGNTHNIINNPNQAVFPGGSARTIQQPAVVNLDLDVQHVAITEFVEETGIQTILLGNQFQLRSPANAVVAIADRVTYYHGQGFHAMILWFNSELDLHTITAVINGSINIDNQRYGGANPPPINGYLRSDDELALATLANHADINWNQLFGGNNQDWFRQIFNNAVNM